MNRRALLVALAGMLASWAWQAATVRANFGGNWTALFHTGEWRERPPQLAGENLMVFPGELGYDGYLYHYLAHDPLLVRGFDKYLDTPRMRGQRVLYSLTAYVLALGRDEWVDRACIAACLLWTGLGIYWSALLARERGLGAVAGLLFLALPATIVSVNRLTVDVTLAALTAGAVLYCRWPDSRALLAILALAPLSRETGFLLTGGFCLHALLEGNYRRMFRYAAATIPAVLWLAVLTARTAPYGFQSSYVPFAAALRSLLQTVQYRDGLPFGGLIVAMDKAALFGMMLVILLGVAQLAAVRRTPIAAAAALFALLALFVQHPNIWVHAFDFGRLYSPLLVLLAGRAPAPPLLISSFAWALVVPRVLAEFGFQVLAVLGLAQAR